MMSSKALLYNLLANLAIVASSSQDCKCTPDSSCWPSRSEWDKLNTTLSGALLKGTPPGSVCYSSQPNYDEEACALVRSQWFNSTWHAQDPVSIDCPIWTNNSCNPIWPNGTSISGDVEAGERGCSIGNYPIYVVNATAAEQIASALVWAGRKNVRVIVKNTGHSYPGRSIGYGSLSIWTHHFRDIEYIPSFEPTSCPRNNGQTAVRIAAGVTGGEAQAEMAKHDSIIVTGANPDVGIIGWITGGGHGWLSSTYGMGADNLLEATIVTPQGKTLVTNPCQNSELFFAIRGGGGGTYGVVLDAVVKAFLTPKATRNIFSIKSLRLDTPSEFWELMGFLHAEMQRLKEGGMQGYYFIVGPPIMPTLSFIWTFMLFDKPNGTVEPLIAPIEDHLKARADLFAYQSNITHAETYYDFAKDFHNEAVATGGSAYGSRLLSPSSLSDPATTAKVLFEIGPSNNASAPNGVFANPLLIGHMTASPHIPDYYPSAISMHPAWRDTLVHFVVVQAIPDGLPQSLIDAVYRDVTVNKTEPLRRLSPETGAYFNEPDSYEPNWQKAFFGGNYGGLKDVKKRVDPDNVLWCRRCVGSEELIEQSDGRLCQEGREHMEL